MSLDTIQSRPVFAMTLVGAEIVYGAGRVQHGEIIFTFIRKIKVGRFSSRITKAKEKLESVPEGTQVIVEDASGQLSDYGLNISLGDADPLTGDSFQRKALTTYFQLAELGGKHTANIQAGSRTIPERSLGALVFRDEAVRFVLERENNDRINVLYDDNGRAKFDVDPEKGLEQGHRCILLMVLGLTGTLNGSAAAGSDFFDLVDREMRDGEEDPYLAGGTPALRSILRNKGGAANVIGGNYER